MTINPGQPAGKGRKKKTLGLTLGSPPEKGGGKKKKKNPGINPGQVWRLHSEPAGKGRKKKKEKKTWSCPSIEVLKSRSTPEWTDRRIDRHTVVII
jgi:hypothetical protein